MDRYISMIKILHLLHLLCDCQIIIIQIIYKFCYKNARILVWKRPCVLLLVKQGKFLDNAPPSSGGWPNESAGGFVIGSISCQSSEIWDQACGSSEHIILPWRDQIEGEISPDITAQTHHACEFVHVRSGGSCRRSSAVFHLVFITHKSAACGIVSGLGIGSQSRVCC